MGRVIVDRVPSLMTMNNNTEINEDVLQIKPTNYTGSFNASDALLEQIWWVGAYNVKVNLESTFVVVGCSSTLYIESPTPHHFSLEQDSCYRPP